MTAPPSGPARGGAERFRLGRVDFVRIGSALVLAPLAILAAYVGGWLFTLFWGLAALGVVGEWVFLVDRQHAFPALIAGGLALVVAIALVGLNRILPAIAVIALGAVGVAALAGSRRRAWCGVGVLYAGALLVAPATLRADVQWGLLAVLILFAVVWTTDIAAYFGGRALRGPKLWARISPNKTWSGAVTGMLAAVLAASVVAKLGGAEHVWPIAALAAGLSVIGQAGDLLESGIKRHFGAKDASHIIPGHGGIMDRLDAFVTASAVAALIGCVRGTLAAPAHGLLVW